MIRPLNLLTRLFQRYGRLHLVWKLLYAVLALSILIAALAYTQIRYFPHIPTPPPAALGRLLNYSVSSTEIGRILDHPDGKKLLENRFPGLTNMEQLDVTRPMTLPELQHFRPDLITESGLGSINLDLAGLREFLAPSYSTKYTPIGTLMDNPETLAILERHIPGFSKIDRIELARPFTLEFCKTYEPTIFNDKALAGINADFEELSKK